MNLSPALDCVLTAQSLEPASDSVLPSFSAPPLLTLCLSVCLCLSKINKGKEDVIPAPKELVGHINFDEDLYTITKPKIVVA